MGILLMRNERNWKLSSFKTSVTQESCSCDKVFCFLLRHMPAMLPTSVLVNNCACLICHLKKHESFNVSCFDLFDSILLRGSLLN